MLFKNANLFMNGTFCPGSFRVENGKFTEILEITQEEIGVDLKGLCVIPGLIDIHSHGNSGVDFSDGTYNGVCQMATYLAENGITGFAPASMTLPYKMLADAYSCAARLQKETPAGCARLLGIQMEGPFFSDEKKGAQNAAYLKPPDIGAFFDLYEAAAGAIRVVDVAAELPGALEFIAEARKYCTVSLAHTDCTYEQAVAAFRAGARHLTHLFNAMPGIHHREPGPIGAASERDDVTAELICDGHHVHPSAVRMAFRLFPGRICLISDALRCCGMPDGNYLLGEQAVCLRGGVARLEDGTLAGSATNLFDCMRKAIAFGIPKEEAIRAATETRERSAARMMQLLFYTI